MIFDCDGVRVDSEHLSCGAWLPVLARHGAEAEIAEDPARWLEGFYFGASGDAPELAAGERAMAWVAPGTQLRDRFRYPDGPLPWLSADDLAFYVAEFARAGFRGGLNRYRCVDLDWEDLRAFHGAPIRQPSLFIGGEDDGPTMWGAGSISRYPQTLPNLFPRRPRCPPHHHQG